MLSICIQYLLYSAWVVQLQFGNDTARLQCCSSPLHIVNTTRLGSSEGHDHLHYLKFTFRYFTSIQLSRRMECISERFFFIFLVKGTHRCFNILYLYFSIALARKHMPAVLDCVLNDFSC